MWYSPFGILLQAAAFLLLLTSDETSAPQRHQSPKQPDIQFPVLPSKDEKPDPPKPKPDDDIPQRVSSLEPDTLYVIRCAAPMIVLHSPEGLLDVEHESGESGSVIIYGRFADSAKSVVERRIYKDKHLYIVRGKAKGQAEIIVVPVGVESADGIARRTLVVMGTGPQPPPPDPPKPDPPKPDPPKPDPQPDTAEKLEVLIVEDALQRSTEFAIVLNASFGFAQQMMSVGHDWRLYDKGSTEPRGKEAAAAAAGRDLPVLIIRDRATKRTLTVEPFPNSLDALKAKIAKHTKVMP